MRQWILPAVMSLSLGAGAHQTFEPISPPQDTERHPNKLLLRREKRTHFPDGHFAVVGVLQRRYCFSEPTAVCVPAGSTVGYSGQMGGYYPHTGATVPSRPVSLSWVDATAPITA